MERGVGMGDELSDGTAMSSKGCRCEITVATMALATYIAPAEAPDVSAAERIKTTGENSMPVISWEGGKLSSEQKKELVKRLTEVAVEVTKVPAQFHIVLIREQEDGNLGVAGETVEDLKARMAAK